MSYQFQIDNRPAAPVRVSWTTAAQDAVSAGYAQWCPEGVMLDTTQGASIERIEE